MHCFNYSFFYTLRYFFLSSLVLGLASSGFAQNATTNIGLKKHRSQVRNNTHTEHKTTLRLRGRDVPVTYIDHSNKQSNTNNYLFQRAKPNALMGKFPALSGKKMSGGWVASSQYDPNAIYNSPIWLQIKGSKDNAIPKPEQDRNATLLLQSHRQLLQIDNPQQEFALVNSETDHLGITHIKLQQMYQGVPIWGKQLFVHHLNDNEVIINGRFVPSPQNLSTMPYFTPESAIEKTSNDLAQKTTLRDLSNEEKELLNYEQPNCELVIYEPIEANTKNHTSRQNWLCYHITIRPNLLERWEYFIDAHTGNIVAAFNNTCSDGPQTANITDLNSQTQLINTYQVGSTYYMIDASRPMFNSSASDMPNDPIGAIWCISANNTALQNISQITTNNNNAWSSPKSASAMSNAARAYEYFKNTHNRNSLNGSGGTIISVINVTESNGMEMDNAFWNGQFMAYGNGDQLCDKPLAAALDVAGHELTHGVIENSSANLTYMGQSGALNESFADIFGCMIDRNDWTMGEDIINNAVIPSGVLRSISNPHNGASSPATFYWQPENMSEYQNLSSNQDNGGVHINSGIVNKAFYLYATAVSKEKAERVYYRALTQYLTSNSQFIDCRLAIIQAASDIYGASSFEVQAARSAFDGVQIYGGTSENNNTEGTGGTSSNDDYPAVNGTDWLYVCDNAGSYIVNPVTADFTALIDGAHLNNASIDDSGSIAFFVASDGNIYSTTLNASNPTIEQWSDDGSWINVSVSRDGTKLALVDNSSTSHTLYVYHITSNQSYAFNLYNPSYSSTTSGGVQYADALEWDFTGEYIMYDAYNAVTNTNGSSIVFWDINFINVWNNSTNQTADGTVEKLYASLPNGISIGNAVFSKNSPYIIAFDVLDENQNTFYLLGSNIISGAEGEILSSNSVAGVPTYSKNDNFLGFTTVNGSNEDMVAKISLASDKISSNGSPTGIISGGKWGVWYTVGTRPNTGCVGFGANIVAQGSTQICSGSSVILDAGAGYTTYAWSGGGNTRYKTVSSAGTYTVSVTQGTCSAVSPPITISIKPAPTASFNYLINGSDVQFNNISQNADTYLWNFGDGTTATEGNPFHHYNTIGNKTATLTSSSNCGTQTSSQTFNISIVGLSDNPSNIVQISILPNPSNGQFVLTHQGLSQTASIAIYDLKGMVVYKGIVSPNEAQTPIQLNSPSGLYLLQVNADNNTWSQKFVIE